MRIKEGFVLRTICGQKVVSGEGLDQVNFSKLISLNETAAFLWEAVAGKDFTAGDLTALLVERYEVSEAVAGSDVRKLIRQWEEMGLVEA